jgi:hypothetical protein
VKLHRPLRLPKLVAGTDCPVSGGRQIPGWHGQTLNGRGPAFLIGVGDAPVGAIDVSQSQTDAQGWRGQKTPWAVRWRYQGPVLIRGGRIDKPGAVSFAFGYGQHLRELHWPAGASAQPPGAYRFLASATLFRSPGCYAFQADGNSFSIVIVMRVTG